MKLAIKKLLSPYVSSRKSIVLIENELKQPEEKVIFDFKDVTFVTPSFIAELNKLVKSYPKVEFEYVNVSKSAESMFEVAKSRELKSRSKEKVFKKDLETFDLHKIYAN